MIAADFVKIFITLYGIRNKTMFIMNKYNYTNPTAQLSTSSISHATSISVF